MKLWEFRDDGVRERLWKGVRQWRDSSGDHRIVEPPSTFRDRIKTVWWVLVAGGCYYYFLGDAVDSIIYLGHVLVLACLLAGGWMFFRSRWQENPVILIAPVTNRGMKRQVIREVLVGKTMILFAAALMGWFFLPGLPVWEGTLKTITASLGLAGLLLNLVCLFNWKWIIRVGVLLFFGIVFRSLHSGYAAALQHWFDQQTWLAFWEGGAVGWQRCFVLLASGAVSFGYWFRRGILTMPLDRHWQAEQDDGEVESAFSDESALETSRTREPIGLVERLMWRFLSPDERVLARIAGLATGNCGKTWLVGVAWLTGGAVVLSFGVEVFGSENHSLWFILSVMVLSFYFWGALIEMGRPRSLDFVEEVGIGPNSQGPVFQVLPISFRSLRSLFWKEALFRIPLAASIGVLAPILVFGVILEQGFGISAWVFGVCLVLVIVGLLWLNFLFWKRALSCVLARRVGAFAFLWRGDLVCGLATIPLLVSLFGLPQGRLPWEGVVLATGLALLLGWLGDRMARARLKHPASDLVRPLLDR